MEGPLPIGARDASRNAATSRTLELRRGEAAPESRAKLEKLAAGFESIFTSSLIGEMLKPVLDGESGGLLGSGPGASIVQGLFESNLSEHVAKAGGFGIGRMIVRTLEPQLAAKQVSVEQLQSSLTRSFPTLETALEAGRMGGAENVVENDRVKREGDR
jgi:Rod binding domain-containing protein